MSRPLIVAIDRSEKSKAVLDAAATFASDMKAPVKVLHLRELEAYGRGGVVWDETRDDASQEVDEAVTQLRDAGISAEGVTTGIGTGAVARAIVEFAQQNDAVAIMVGSKGHSQIAQLLVGSTTHKLLHLIDRPLIVIP